MKLRIIQHRRWWYVISGILFVIGVAALFIWGLRWGLDFIGGSSLELEFLNANRPDVEIVRQLVVDDFKLNDVTVQTSGDKSIIMRFETITDETRQQILTKIGEMIADPNAPDTAVPTVNQLHFESIGPAVGQELRQKSIWAIILAIIGIVSYIAWAFRKVSRPVESWKYGTVAVVALAHDVVITCGMFAIAGHLFGMEVNTPFIAAVLTILGYSVHDTIVVFDRTRENLHRYHGDFEETVNQSVNETFARSINTTVATLLAVVAVLIFGGATIRPFALALTMGIFFGAYSSIFIASPLLVTWQKWGKR